MYFINVMHCIISTTQTDVSQTYRTFSLKIISCLHFVKSLKCGKLRHNLPQIMVLLLPNIFFQKCHFALLLSRLIHVDICKKLCEF